MINDGIGHDGKGTVIMIDHEGADGIGHELWWYWLWIMVMKMGSIMRVKM